MENKKMTTGEYFSINGVGIESVTDHKVSIKYLCPVTDVNN